VDCYVVTSQTLELMAVFNAATRIVRTEPAEIDIGNAWKAGVLQNARNNLHEIILLGRVSACSWTQPSDSVGDYIQNYP
jgi:hypothetical protein